MVSVTSHESASVCAPHDMLSAAQPLANFFRPLVSLLTRVKHVSKLALTRTQMGAAV